MDIFTITMWIGTGVFLIFSLIKDKEKTKTALKMAKNMGIGMAGGILSIVFSIGMLLAFFPPERISTFVATQSDFVGTIGCAVFGTITLIPAFIAFPLVGTLVDAGISVMPAVAFLTTLTMVGVVTFPLEKREFGLKFSIARNVLSFIFAIIIAGIMGLII